MTKIIGLTGGIGSGKTTVANIFRSHGIPVYIADEEAKKITDDPKVVARIVEIFGNEILDDGLINRKVLATVVFNDAEKLKQLNSIIHPAVKKHFLQWVEHHQNQPFVIKEAAILFETGNDKDCDAVITVTAPLETRISRVMQRDKASREEILKRIDNQWPDEMRISKSNFIINNIEPYKTEFQVNEILKKLRIF